MTTEGKNLPVGLSYKDAQLLRRACDDDPFLFLRVVCGYDKLSTTFHAPLVYMLAGKIEKLYELLSNSEFLKKSYPAREIASILRNRHGITDLGSFAQYTKAVRLFDFINLRQYRGSGKSSIGHGIDAWEHAVDPQNTILICSAAEDRAVSFSRQVKQIYEGEVFQALYPERYTGATLTDRRISLHGRKPTSPQAGIEAWGYGASIVGAHFNIFSIDDLTIDTNVFDVTLGIPRFLAGLSGLYEPRRIRRRHLGTVWDELDDHYILSNVETCFSLVIPIEDFGGEEPEDIRMRGIPTNPEWHPTDKIEELQQEIFANELEGPASWRRNYMLNLNVGGGRMFSRRLLDNSMWYPHESTDDRGRKSEWAIVYARDRIGGYVYDDNGEPETLMYNLNTLSTYVGCDQSVSDDGDEWGVAAVGVHPNGTTFVLETATGHGYERMLNTVINISHKWKPIRIGFEKGGMQDSTLYWVDQDPRFASLRGLIEGVPTGGTRKDFRISNTVAEPMRINRLYIKFEDEDCITSHHSRVCCPHVSL